MDEGISERPVPNQPAGPCPRSAGLTLPIAFAIHEWEILTQPGQKRLAILVSVDRLHEVIPSLEAEQLKINHIYDY